MILLSENNFNYQTVNLRGGALESQNIFSSENNDDQNNESEDNLIQSGGEELSTELLDILKSLKNNQEAGRGEGSRERKKERRRAEKAEKKKAEKQKNKSSKSSDGSWDDRDPDDIEGEIDELDEKISNGKIKKNDMKKYKYLRQSLDHINGTDNFWNDRQEQKYQQIMDEFSNGTRVEYKESQDDRRRGRRDDDGDYGDGRDAYEADGRGKGRRRGKNFGKTSNNSKEVENFNGGKKRKNSLKSSSISSLDDSESESNSNSNSDSDEGYLSTSSLNTSDINIKHYR